ncbi:hypothetical protein D3C72_1610400 [compost metagenome]
MVGGEVLLHLFTVGIRPVDLTLFTDHHHTLIGADNNPVSDATVFTQLSQHRYTVQALIEGALSVADAHHFVDVQLFTHRGMIDDVTVRDHTHLHVKQCFKYWQWFECSTNAHREYP